MYLIIRNSDNVIEGTENIPSQYLNLVEPSYTNNNRYLIEIDDEEFSEDMLGAIYDGGEEVVGEGSPVGGSTISEAEASAGPPPNPSPEIIEEGSPNN